MARLPALFVGHGNPLFALQPNAYTAAWGALGAGLAGVRAILAISAHWYGPGVAVTAMAQPRTIHDFGGFPAELYRLEYPAPGDPALAAQLGELLAPVPVALDHDWGLDHGTWSVLRYLRPQADLPVVQLRLDSGLTGAEHFALARRLAALREAGVLILGSGNLVHNLRTYGWGEAVAPFDWAERFERRARALMLAGDTAALCDYPALGQDARLAIPTPDHYLPLLYVLGVRHPDDALTFPVEGMDGGSISMLAVRLGSA